MSQIVCHDNQSLCEKSMWRLTGKSANLGSRDLATPDWPNRGASWLGLFCRGVCIWDTEASVSRSTIKSQFVLVFPKRYPPKEEGKYKSILPLLPRIVDKGNLRLENVKGIQMADPGLLFQSWAFLLPHSLRAKTGPRYQGWEFMFPLDSRKKPWFPKKVGQASWRLFGTCA